MKPFSDYSDIRFSLLGNIWEFFYLIKNLVKAEFSSTLVSLSCYTLSSFLKWVQNFLTPSYSKLCAWLKLYSQFYLFEFEKHLQIFSQLCLYGDCIFDVLLKPIFENLLVVTLVVEISFLYLNGFQFDAFVSAACQNAEVIIQKRAV